MNSEVPGDLGQRISTAAKNTWVQARCNLLGTANGSNVRRAPAPETARIQYVGSLCFLYLNPSTNPPSVVGNRQAGFKSQPIRHPRATECAEMRIWDPFDPVVYFLHTIVGTLGVVGALFALSLRKGSRGHRIAGWIFVTAACIAAATAVAFSFTEFSPLALASGVMTFSALGAAVLAVRPRNRAVVVGEGVTTVLMGLAFLWLSLGVVLSMGSGAWLPPFLYSLFPLVLLVSDIRFLRLDEAGRARSRLPRHYSRMAFALAIAVHAPIVSFSDRIPVHPALSFFGPFILWPLIVVAWKRRAASRTVPV